MKQFMAEVVIPQAGGAFAISKRSFYLPGVEDVRTEIAQRGWQVLEIKEQKRSVIERLLARSSAFQLALLRQINFASQRVSPAVAFARMVEAETDPRRQNILAPAREIIDRGLSIIQALKALKIFDGAVMAILSAADKAGELKAGIPYAMKMIQDSGKARRQIMGTVGFLAFDLISVIQTIIFGRDFIFDYLKGQRPADPAKAVEFDAALWRVDLTWDVLLWIAYLVTAFGAWVVVANVLNHGKADHLAARVVQRIPLVGHYIQDLGMADSVGAAARMLEGGVRVDESLREAGEIVGVPAVRKYWQESVHELRKGVQLGVALDRQPLTRMERDEIMGVATREQAAETLAQIAEMRRERAKFKHTIIVWVTLVGTGLYLVVAVVSALSIIGIMDMSINSMLERVMGGT